MEIDDIDVPDLDITEAHQFVTTIHDDLSGSFTTATQEELALAHGHDTADSGAFRGKISSLRKWGLIEGRGEKELTELGRALYSGECTLTELVENVPCFELAHSIFGVETPSKSEWMAFAEEQGISDASERELEAAWARYNNLVRFCQDPDSARENTPFDLARFEKYREKLQNDRTRPFAIEAIEDQVTSPLPGIDPFEAILEIVREERYPDHRSEFIEILRNMCQQSPELIREEGYQDAVYTLGVRILQKEVDGSNREAVKMVQAVLIGELTKNRSEELWDLAQGLVEEGVESENATPSEMGDRLARSLIEEWAGPGFLRTIEDDIWETIGRDEDYDLYYDTWLKECRQELSNS